MGVSEPVAKAMVEGVVVIRADVSISVTGIADPVGRKRSL